MSVSQGKNGEIKKEKKGRMEGRKKEEQVKKEKKGRKEGTK